jgi:hypothetical protein
MMEEGEWHRGKRRSGYGSAPEEHIKRRSKRGSIRSRDGGAIDVGESSRADGIGEGATVERGGGQLGLTLMPHRVTPFILLLKPKP